MCSVLDEIEAKGVEKGERLGIEKGERLGIEKGEKLGIEKGEKLGIEKGEKRGLVKSAKLATYLLHDGRVDLLEQLASMDDKEIEELLRKYNI